MDAPKANAPGPVDPAERKALLLLALGVCWALAGYILVRETWIRFWWDRNLLDWTVNPLVLSTGADRWLVPLALLGRYAALLVAPARLALDYGGLVISPQARPGDPYLYLGAAALALWTVLLVGAARRRAWPTVFCLLGVGITYGVVANVITLIGTVFAERLVYLPSAFFVILAAQALARLPRRGRAAALGLLLLLASLRTWTYARLWNDRVTIYAASAAAQPRSVQARLLLSNELRRRGEFGRAEEAAAAARALAPGHWEVYYYSGLNALERGDLDAADAYAGKALALKQAMPAIGLFGMIREARAATQPTTQPTPAPAPAPDP
jgi:tetratricopeptide (TPR) repeat protein